VALSLSGRKEKAKNLCSTGGLAVNTRRSKNIRKKKQQKNTRKYSFRLS
jgi:hypothetical protein